MPTSDFSQGVEWSYPCKAGLNRQDGGEKIKVAFCMHPVEFHSFNFTPSRDPVKGLTQETDTSLLKAGGGGLGDFSPEGDLLLTFSHILNF